MKNYSGYIPKVDDLDVNSIDGPVKIEGKKTLHIDLGLDVIEKVDSDIFRMQVSKSSFINQLNVCVKYINYFMKYFDHDNELRTAYAIQIFQIKNSETQKSMTIEFFLECLEIYFGKDTLLEKFKSMVDYNMIGNKLEPPKTKTTESVQITDDHYNALMMLSCIFKCIIPIISTFYTMRKDLMVTEDGMRIDEKSFYYICFSRFIHFVDEIYDIDLYSKMYHTGTTRAAKTFKDVKLWERRKQFGESVTTQQSNLMMDLFVDLIQKGLFNKNIINLIHVSFDRNIKNLLNKKDKHDIITVDTTAVSDNDDEPSKFDNLQMSWTKFSIEQKSRAEELIESHIEDLCEKYDIKITDDMIDFYRKRFSKNKVKTDNYKPSSDIQINLIYLFFSKYTKSFTVNDFMKPKWFIKIIIIFKEIYRARGFIILPLLVSGDIDKMDSKRFNKQQLKKRILEHPDYPQLKDEYVLCGEHINKDKAIDSLRDLVTNKVYIVDHKEPERTERREYIDISNNYQTIANEIVRFLLDL